MDALLVASLITTLLDHSKVDAFYANAIQAGGRDNEPQASAHILVRTIMLHL